MFAQISALRAVIAYVRAGNFVDTGDFRRAKQQMDLSLDLLGSRIDRPSTYEFFLRAVRIELNLGRAVQALAYLDEAIARITRSKKLLDADRKYLLDFCNVSKSEIEGTEIGKLHLRAAEHENVSKWIRRYYPIAFA